MAVLDAATMLMPHGTYNSTQSFAPLQISPRHLATTMLQVHMLTPPSASCTLTVEIASTAGGVYSPITSIPWPAGVAGSRQVAFGVHSALAKVLNTTSAWMRLSLATTGALTGSAWLTKPSDGSFGLASRSYHLEPV
jgi:hypothetical protein